MHPKPDNNPEAKIGYTEAWFGYPCSKDIPGHEERLQPDNILLASVAAEGRRLSPTRINLVHRQR
jgi:hypothetical protein